MNKNRAVETYFQELDLMGQKSLLKACKIVKADKNKIIKGGIVCRLNNSELRRNIRRAVGRGNFPESRQNLAKFLSNWRKELSDRELENIKSEKEDNEEQLLELLQKIYNLFINLPDPILFDLIENWISYPENLSEKEDELDYILEQLGFFWEEKEEEFELIYPSPFSLRKKINQMNLSEFYQIIISLAGISLPQKEFSPPPSCFFEGYEFLEEFKEYLEAILKQN